MGRARSEGECAVLPMTAQASRNDGGVRGGFAKPTSVLIVDDNSDMRSFVRIVLERAGFEAQVAADGERALDLQRAHPVDVLITDIFMPERDGIELIHQFKSAFPQVKIIAMSGGGESPQGTICRLQRISAPIWCCASPSPRIRC